MKKSGWFFTMLGGLGNIVALIIKDTNWYRAQEWAYDLGVVDDIDIMFKIIKSSVYLLTGFLLLGILLVVLSYIQYSGGKINTSSVAGEVRGKVQNVIKTGAIAMGKIAFCDVCGQDISPNDTFCRHCSSKISKPVHTTKRHTSVCQSCENPIDDNAVFCDACGNKIIRYESADVSITRENSQKIFCVSCGNSLSKDSSFCNKCGAKVF